MQSKAHAAVSRAENNAVSRQLLEFLCVPTKGCTTATITVRVDEPIMVTATYLRYIDNEGAFTLQRHFRINAEEIQNADG